MQALVFKLYNDRTIVCSLHSQPYKHVFVSSSSEIASRWNDIDYTLRRIIDVIIDTRSRTRDTSTQTLTLTMDIQMQIGLGTDLSRNKEDGFLKARCYQLPFAPGLPRGADEP